jgi:esterase/lipase
MSPFCSHSRSLIQLSRPAFLRSGITARFWTYLPDRCGRCALAARDAERKHTRKDRDPELSEEAAAAQREAIQKYFAPAEGVLDYLKDIRHPTLVVNGSNDVMVPTVNSYVLQRTCRTRS